MLSGGQGDRSRGGKAERQSRIPALFARAFGSRDAITGDAGQGARGVSALA